MTLIIDDDILTAARMSVEQVRLELAVVLFQTDRLTLAQAAELAETDRLTFQHVLGARGIALHYTDQDLTDDLRNIHAAPKA